jgi:hypothetical protein
MQVQFTNTDKTAGTIDGRNFTISAAGKIWVNRARPSKAAEAAILAAKAEAAKKAEKPAKAVSAKKASKPATVASFMLQQLGAAAAKPAAKKAEAPAGGRAPSLADDSKITLLVKENPKREGCAAYERFQAYFKVTTVAEALAAGLTRKDLAWDIAHGHITVK